MNPIDIALVWSVNIFQCHTVVEFLFLLIRKVAEAVPYVLFLLSSVC